MLQVVGAIETIECYWHSVGAPHGDAVEQLLLSNVMTMTIRLGQQREVPRRKAAEIGDVPR